MTGNRIVPRQDALLCKRFQGRQATPAGDNKKAIPFPECDREILEETQRSDGRRQGVEISFSIGATNVLRGDSEFVEWDQGEGGLW